MFLWVIWIRKYHWTGPISFFSIMATMRSWWDQLNHPILFFMVLARFLAFVIASSFLCSVLRNVSPLTCWFDGLIYWKLMKIHYSPIKIHDIVDQWLVTKECRWSPKKSPSPIPLPSDNDDDLFWSSCIQIMLEAPCWALCSFQIIVFEWCRDPIGMK